MEQALTEQVELEGVRKRFREANMPGALKFLDFLLSDEGKKRKVVAGIVACKEGAARISLGASHKDPDATPLEDLLRFSLDLRKQSPENLPYIDAFMAGYATNPPPNVPVIIESAPIN